MRWFWLALLMCGALLTPRLYAQRTSALIGQALDKQLPQAEFKFSGTLPQAIAAFGDMTGVRIEADDAVYDALPWGDLTTFHAEFKHQTLRQALTAICQKLGLQYDLQDQAVHLSPLPALQRLGRRCTVEELQALDLLGRTPLEAKELSLPAVKLLALIDDRLEKSPYAVENRAFPPQNKTTLNVSRHSTLLDALEEISLQTSATWYPWGQTIVVLGKTDQICMQHSKRISTRFNGEDVSDVLLELSKRSGVAFQIQPGAVQKIAPQFRTIRLVLDNATIQQTLESISGFTGLAYTVTDDGVRIYTPLPATAAATTQSN